MSNGWSAKPVNCGTKGAGCAGGAGGCWQQYCGASASDGTNTAASAFSAEAWVTSRPSSGVAAMGSAARKASSVIRRTSIAEEGLGVGGQSVEGVAAGDESNWRLLLTMSNGGPIIEGTGSLQPNSPPGIANGTPLGAWPWSFIGGFAHARP